MKHTVLEPKRPADIDAGEHLKHVFTKAGLRQRVTLSKRLLEEFGLKGNPGHPGWHVLAWAVRCTLTGCLPALERDTSRCVIRVAEYLSFPPDSGQPETRSIAVTTTDSSNIHVSLPEEALKEPDRRLTVLLVEDDLPVSQVALILIRRLGVDAVHATNGHEGFELAKRLVPEAIITDVDLPGMSGVELCERLKADPVTTGIPVLVWSGNPHHREKAMAAGAVDFLTKPNEAARLTDRLRQMLGG